MKLAVIASFVAILFLVSACSADVIYRPGLLPGVWWGIQPAGPPITVQPMQRVRIRVFRPWFLAVPPVIQYPRGPYSPVQVMPGSSAPTWGEYQGRWGWGVIPQQNSTVTKEEQ